MEAPTKEEAAQCAQAAPTNNSYGHDITSAELLYDEIRPYVDNLNRMARRAVDDPGFYAIAGATVQRLADEISVQRIADEYYDDDGAA